MEGPEITVAEAVIDNGSFGTRTVRFETGRLAKQAAGSVSIYLDNDTMLLSAMTSSASSRGTSPCRPPENAVASPAVFVIVALL